MPWRSGWGTGAAGGMLVESAGTWGHEGAPMEEHAAEVLLEHGADPEGFLGRELLDEHVIRADLVLTATRDHRAQVVSMGHSAGLRTFTLKEFTRLVRAIDAGHAAGRALGATASSSGPTPWCRRLRRCGAGCWPPAPRRTRSMIPTVRRSRTSVPWATRSARPSTRWSRP